MTVLFFTRLFYPHIGGVEKHVLEVGKRLVKKGYRVIVITENYNLSRSKNYHSLPSTDNIEGIEVIRINGGNDGTFKKFTIWFNLIKYVGLMKRADIIHAHDVFYWYLPFKFIFPFKKVYTTFHGYEGNELPAQNAIFMHRLAEKFSDGNICVGDFFKKWYGTKPTAVTYGAVGLKISDLISKDTKIYKKPKLKIVFVGRLEEEAGIMTYLEALKLLKNKRYDFQISVLGDGAKRKDAEKFCITNKIEADFKGFIEDTDKYVMEADIVFVSRYLGILEAMAMGKPVFAEYNNAIKKDYLEMAPFAGYISISKGEKELASNIENFIKGKSNVSTKKAYAWVKDKTWDNMVNLYLKLWRIN